MKDSELIIKLLIEDKQAMAKLKRALRTTQKESKKAASVFSEGWVKALVKVTAVTYAIKKLTSALLFIPKRVIAVGAEFERLEMELRAFTASADEATEIVKELVKYSARTPFQVAEIIEAAKALKIFSKDTNELILMLQAAGNVAAAFLGGEITLSALQMQRAFSSGIAAADLFRDKTVRAFFDAKLGVDSTTLSVEELKEKFIEVFTSGEIGLATIRLSKTFDGLMSTLRDNFTLIFKDIADAGFFESIKTDLSVILATIVGVRDESDNYTKTVEQLSDLFIDVKNSATAFIGTLILGSADAIDFLSNARIELMQLGDEFVRAKILSEEMVKWGALGPIGVAIALKNTAEQMEEYNETMLRGAEEQTNFGERAREMLEGIQDRYAEARLAMEEEGLLDPLPTPDAVEERLDILQNQIQSFIEGIKKGFGEVDQTATTFMIEYGKQVGIATKKTSGMFAKTTTDILFGVKSSKTAFKDLGLQIAQMFVQMTIEMIAQRAMVAAFGAFTTSVIAATGAAAASAMATPAALTSLATGGANSVPAQAGIVSTVALAQSLAAIPKLEKGIDDFSGGLALVGEKGPELVNLPRGADVIPNNRLGGMVVNIEMNNPIITSDEAKDEFIRDMAVQISAILDQERSRL